MDFVLSDVFTYTSTPSHLMVGGPVPVTDTTHPCLDVEPLLLAHTLRTVCLAAGFCLFIVSRWQTQTSFEQLSSSQRDFYCLGWSAYPVSSSRPLWSALYPQQLETTVTTSLGWGEQQQAQFQSLSSSQFYIHTLSCSWSTEKGPVCFSKQAWYCPRGARKTVSDCVGFSRCELSGGRLLVRHRWWSL